MIEIEIGERNGIAVQIKISLAIFHPNEIDIISIDGAKRGNRIKRFFTTFFKKIIPFAIHKLPVKNIIDFETAVVLKCSMKQ